MKSALKPPGTPGRFLDPRSPTFKEEVVLENEEEKTEKQNAADVVSLDSKSTDELSLIGPTESQDPSAHGQVLPPRGQLQLFSHRPLHAVHDLFHL